MLDDGDLPDILLRYAASEVVYLQSWILFTYIVRSSIGRAEIYLHAQPQLPACRARNFYLQSWMQSTCRVRSVYLQSRTQSNCIVRYSLCAEPKAVAMSRPDAHILPHVDLDMHRGLKDYVQGKTPALKVYSGRFSQSSYSNVKYTAPYSTRLELTTNNLFIK